MKEGGGYMCPLGRATIDEGDGAKAKSTRQVGQARANICRPCVLQVLNGSLPHSKSTALDANATPQPFRPPRRRLPSIRRVVVQAMGHACHHSLHTSWATRFSRSGSITSSVSVLRLSFQTQHRHTGRAHSPSYQPYPCFLRFPRSPHSSHSRRSWADYRANK